jgi:hypothetical protein
MRQGRPLVAFNNGGVLVDGREGLFLALLLIKLGDPPHTARLHFLQRRHRPAGGKDKALLLLPRRPQLLQVLVVEPLQKIPRRRGLGRLVPQPPFQAGVVGQEPQVFRALPAQDLEQDQRLDDLGFGESALALAQR